MPQQPASTAPGEVLPVGKHKTVVGFLPTKLQAHSDSIPLGWLADCLDQSFGCSESLPSHNYTSFLPLLSQLPSRPLCVHSTTFGPRRTAVSPIICLGALTSDSHPGGDGTWRLKSCQNHLLLRYRGVSSGHAVDNKARPLILASRLEPFSLPTALPSPVQRQPTIREAPGTLAGSLVSCILCLDLVCAHGSP